MTITFKAVHGTMVIGNGEDAAIKITIGDSLKAVLFYDFREAPLVLSAPAEPGDKIELVIGSFRDELWVNDKLYDEEWCFGQLLPGREVSGSISPEITDSDTVHSPEPPKNRVGLEERRG